MASTIESVVIVAAVIAAVFQRMIVWIVQWARGPERRSTTLDLRDERFARGEIDRTEYEEKRRLIEGRPVRQTNA